MFDGFDSQVYVKFGPVEMTRLRQLDGQDLLDGRISKPGEVSEAHEQLAPS